MHPCFTFLREGIPRRPNYFTPFLEPLYPIFSLSRMDVPRTGSKIPPVGDGSASWLLWHAEKTTSHVETTNGSDPVKRYQIST